MKRGLTVLALMLGIILTGCRQAPPAEDDVRESVAAVCAAPEEAGASGCAAPEEAGASGYAAPESYAAGNSPEQNQYFFPAGRDSATFFWIEPETEAGSEVNVLINEIAVFESGVLYEMKIDHEGDLAEAAVPGGDRLWLGLFYVEKDKIYLLDDPEAADKPLTAGRLRKEGRIVCQEEDGTAEGRGWSGEFINADGSRFDGELWYRGEITRDGKKYIEKFTWERGVGLTAYESLIDGEEPVCIYRPIDYEAAEEQQGIRERNICGEARSVSEDALLCGQEMVADAIEKSEEYDREYGGSGYALYYCLYDLNEDGVEEYFTLFTGPLWNGSAGQRLSILERTADGGWEPIAVLEEENGGYHSFILPGTNHKNRIWAYEGETGKYVLED